MLSSMEAKPVKTNVHNKWYWPVLFVFVLLGIYVSPKFGLVALVCMVAPVVIAPFKGRMWCGRFCPRGSFYDQILTRVGGKKRGIPTWSEQPWVRWLVFGGLMAFFSYNLYLARGNIYGIGRAFLNMVILTTAAGIVLGLIYSPRTWCKICPMGSLAMLLSRGGRAPVKVTASDCITCGLCAKKCPIGISGYQYTDVGQINHPDCIKCDLCVNSCPTGALIGSDDDSCVEPVCAAK